MSTPNQHEEALFQAALNLPPKDRDAYLGGACGEDAQLRGRIVERLFQADRATCDTADESPTSPSTTMGAIPFVQETPGEKPGDTIGRYKLIEKIGEGGFGVVYVAEQKEPLRRRVAVKVIKLGMDTKQVIARFEAERQALALMDHPNIAKVLDAGATDTGRPYFVMELVRGIMITQYCDREQLGTKERLDLFIQVCHAIQHAHQKGIIHRDIKPSNILVTLQEDGRPTPKVIDFGIAKATAGQTLTDKTVFTAFEQFIGTPAYISPEQAEMSGLDIDTRSDIYSRGVLLYELLTGKTPFDAKELIQAGLDGMRRIIREKEPAKPSTRLSTLDAQEQTTVAKRRQSEPPKLIHLVRGDLDWIVMKALEKDRTRRYETANGLTADIQHHLRNEPVVARPPSNLYLLQKLGRRHKLAFAAGIAVAAALLVGFGIYTWLFLAERAARQRADLTEQFLLDVLNGVGPSVALGRDTALLREILDKTAERVGKDLSHQPEVEANLQATLAKVFLAIGQFPKAEATARRALALRQAILGKEHRDVAALLNFTATTLYEQGKLADAESLQRQALTMRRKLLGNAHADIAESLNNLSLTLLDEHRLAEAEDLQRQALAMTRKLLGNEDPSVANSLNNLANILRAEHRLTEAESLQREELVLSRKRLQSEDPDLVTSINNLALLLRDEGKPAEAESLAREALAIRRKVLEAEHPDVAVSLVTLARVLSDRANLVEAETLAREALRIRRKALSEDNPDLAISLDDLARILRSQRKLAEAKTLFREALALRKKLARGPPSSMPAALDELAAAFNQLTMTLLADQKFTEAESLALECLALPGRAKEEDFQACHTRSLLGCSLVGQNKYSDAEPLLLAGYAGMTQRGARIPIEDNSRLKESLQWLVRLYEATGKTNQVAIWKNKLADLDKAGSGE